MTLLAQLDARLNDLHANTAETPLFNPVFQLSLELSRRIESGDLPLSEVAGLVAELECEGLLARAERLEKLVAPLDPQTNLGALEAADGDDFASFAARWQNPLLHVVFTAHPTFLLTQRQSAAVAAAATQGTIEAGTACVAPHERDVITLGSEHTAVLAALANAQGARDAMVGVLYTEARRHWPDQWRELAPVPLRFASWVGYDMDGRTDISWVTSLSYRLTEKAERLRSYATALAGPAADLAERLRAAADYAAIQADRLAATDPANPAALSLTANSFNADHPFKLTSLTPVLAELDRLTAAADDDTALQLLTVAAAMRADGLGMGWVHFRVNASQLQNAIRRRIDPTGKLDLASQAALVRMRELLAEAKPLRSNMAALALESSTAVRQFLAMVQILDHIDADAPIRMLVAECEQPTTVLAALYFAKLFGIDSKVDVSPLFETESALEHGGRFLDALLAEPAYRDYARARGRVAIQAGFSDAGRFVGQVPAALAIERLQGRLAEAMAANGLDDVAALVFNTHGEGMGRGAHPSSFADRTEWPLSPWARRRFVRAGIRLEPEVSFQGGDGYLFFGTPELALATLSRFAEVRPAEADPDAPTDPFYRRTDLSLDFYRAIRRFQAEQLTSRTYSRAVTAFGLGMLNDTGSRKSRRQSDLAADREMSLRQIRAIPHNAVLQQLGYPVNVIGGFGTAAEGNYEALAELLTISARGRQMVRLVRASNALASIKTVAAFGELFNSAYWASRPYRGGEEAISDACLSLAEHLTTDDRTGVFRRLASRLRVDALKLHRLLDLIPDEAPLENREHTRRLMGVLQALRLALYQHMFLRAVSVPQFSRANDIAREDVLEMVFTLRIDEALAQLRRAFPVIVPNLGDFSVTAPSDYPDEAAVGYEAIHRDCIEPIAQAQALALRIATSVANLFGAHG